MTPFWFTFAIAEIYVAFSMSEILNALPPRLTNQLIAFVVVTYAVVMAMRRGERDRKNGHTDVGRSRPNN